jgi:hypothetical protein
MHDRAGGVWVGCRNRDLVNARLRGLGREDGNNGDGDDTVAPRERTWRAMSIGS